MASEVSQLELVWASPLELEQGLEEVEPGLVGKLVQPLGLEVSQEV